MADKSIEQVLKEHTEQLMSLPGVHGTGLGMCDGAPCITIFASDLSDDTRKRIPDRLGGYPVRIKETGPFTARD